MLIRKTPKDRDKYITIDNSNIAYKLQLNGFMPKYIDEYAMYFVKSEKIIDTIKHLKEIDND